jgi:hypothetical protein
LGRGFRGTPTQLRHRLDRFPDLCRRLQKAIGAHDDALTENRERLSFAVFFRWRKGYEIQPDGAADDYDLPNAIGKNLRVHRQPFVLKAISIATPPTGTVAAGRQFHRMAG